MYYMLINLSYMIHTNVFMFLVDLVYYIDYIYICHIFIEYNDYLIIEY